ncbi:MAG: DDE-type integrase/transposase/recombinase [Anaerolineae bacterium]
MGWAMSERMTAALTIRALKMAIRRRQPGADLIHHSDQGSQYTDSIYGNWVVSPCCISFCLLHYGHRCGVWTKPRRSYAQDI